ncbi:hypothetical protein ACFL6I_10010 [candidate division KSB1 bacterium]
MSRETFTPDEFIKKTLGEGRVRILGNDSIMVNDSLDLQKRVLGEVTITGIKIEGALILKEGFFGVVNLSMLNVRGIKSAGASIGTLVIDGMNLNGGRFCIVGANVGIIYCADNPRLAHDLRLVFPNTQIITSGFPLYHPE